MASQEVINLIIDKIAAAFNNDLDAFEAWLERSALETELAAIESAERNLQAQADASASDYVAQLADLAAQRAAKIAEIDAL